MASINLQGDTSGSISISAPSVAGSNTLTLPATTQTLATQNALGVRNLIINGDMRIDQRNAGAIVTLTSGQYTLDRIGAALSQSSKYTVQQSTTAPAGFKNSLLVTSSSSYSLGTSDYFFLNTKIEGQNMAHLNWGGSDAQTITISFWVRSSLTGQFGGALKNSGSTRSYPFSYTILSADTWEQKSVTITGDTTGTWLTTNGIGMEVCLNLGTGSTYSGTSGSWAGTNYAGAIGDTSVVGTSGATFYITGLQLEVGTEATPFEHRPYDMELARCQRYYQLIAGFVCGTGSGSTQCGASVMYKTEMRASPSVGLTAALQVTRVANADFTQSAANVVIAASGARVNTLGVSLDFSNFTGLPSDAALPAIVTGGQLTLTAEL